jgi:AraC-like DNA-binding protein
MDPLTDVFTSMRVESVVYGRLEATAPWALRFEAPSHAKFGIVQRGNCWLTVDGVEPVPLTGGDCYLLPRGDSFTLGDDPHTPARSFSEMTAPECGSVMRYGGGGAPASVIGGKFSFDGLSSRPLTDLLPPVIHIRADEARGRALQGTLQLLAAEITSPGPGSTVIVSRLADTLFVQAIRAHIASAGCMKSGWLRALGDPAIGTALKSMHDRIEHPWTVAELAMSAGMSRSAFAPRFKELVGETPLEYLTRWRMYQAGRLLRDGKRKLFEVAHLVGYESDGAFNKAFKRVLGVTPGEYRTNGGARAHGAA